MDSKTPVMAFLTFEEKVAFKELAKKTRTSMAKYIRRLIRAELEAKTEDTET